MARSEKRMKFSPRASGNNWRERPALFLKVHINIFEFCEQLVDDYYEP
jgi:hypothetical protein